jgi:arylsulfatase A-like enzyme
MKKRIALGLFLSVIVLVFACSRRTEASSAEAQAPAAKTAPAPAGAENVLFIVIDALRADALGLYADRNQTPVIDRLGHGGVVFENAHVQAPFTVASMSSMFAGLYPSLLEISEKTYSIPEEQTLFAEKLAQQGYRTGAFSANWSLTEKMGIYQGFAAVSVIRESGSLPNITNQLTSKAIEFLKADLESPFFLWIMYYDPHLPYDPPQSYRTFKNYKGPLPQRVVGTHKRKHYYPPQDLAYVKSLYLDEVRFVDYHVGRLLDVLEEADVYDRTLVVITADHGEEHYDHRGVWHGHTMYQELLRVPLIIKGPGVPAKKWISSPVEIMGLFPTLEELLELPSAPSDQNRQGRAFTNLIRDPSSSYAKPYLYAEHIFWGEPKRSIRVGNYKLIEWLGFPRFELYDLATDPKERRNLYWKRPEVAEKLKETMAGVVNENERRIRGLPDRSDLELEKEMRERLRALGYIN